MSVVYLLQCHVDGFVYGQGPEGQPLHLTMDRAHYFPPLAT